MEIIVRVPNSLNRPHMVVFKQWSRFYSRNSAGKYQLDVHELCLHPHDPGRGVRSFVFV